MMTFKLIEDENIISYFNTAKAAANKSLCTKRKVGAVLFKNNTFLDGYNYPAFRTDNITVDDDGETLSDIVHAEMDIITKLAGKYHGFNTLDSSIITTLSPCFQCSKNIIRLNIKELYFRDIHKVRPLVLLMANDIKVYQLLECTTTVTTGSDVSITIASNTTKALFSKLLNEEPSYIELIKICKENPKVFLSQNA